MKITLEDVNFDNATKSHYAMLVVKLPNTQWMTYRQIETALEAESVKVAISDSINKKLGIRTTYSRDFWGRLEKAKSL